MESNKILLEVYVPSIEKEYDVFEHRRIPD